MSERIKKIYDLEIKKDLFEIEHDKQQFIKEMKGGLGDKINNFDTYVKKEPTIFDKLKTKIKKIFKVI